MARFKVIYSKLKIDSKKSQTSLLKQMVLYDREQVEKNLEKTIIETTTLKVFRNPVLSSFDPF